MCSCTGNQKSDRGRLLTVAAISKEDGVAAAKNVVQTRNVQSWFINRPTKFVGVAYQIESERAFDSTIL